MEVASLIKTQYVLPVSSSTNGPEVADSNCLTSAQANDLVHRFVEVFARRLENEILQKGTANPTTTTLQTSSYDFPSDISAVSSYSHRSANNLGSGAHAINGETSNNDCHYNQNKTGMNGDGEQNAGRSVPSSSSESEQPAPHSAPSSRKPFYRR